eukprot:scaffold54971_cov47-Attheya_sp.AAC.6
MEEVSRRHRESPDFLLSILLLPFVTVLNLHAHHETDSPFQLRLASADAVTLLVSALAGKDLIYLLKNVGGVGLQRIAMVMSEVQICSVTQLAPGGINDIVISNQEFDSYMTS